MQMTGRQVDERLDRAALERLALDLDGGIDALVVLGGPAGLVDAHAVVVQQWRISSEIRGMPGDRQVIDRDLTCATTKSIELSTSVFENLNTVHPCVRSHSSRIWSFA